MKDLKDITTWTAVVTPFHDNLKVDYNSLKKHLQLQSNTGCGVLLLGSTGEGLALSVEEKKEIIRFSCSLNLPTPIMVGVGGFNLNQTLDWLAFCEEQPIDAYLMVVPMYAKPGPKGQEAWFHSLLDAVQRPCMLYNVPSRTGISLSREALEALDGHPNFWAIKEASNCTEEYQAYREAVPNIPIFSGEDARVPHYSKYGCAGLVSVAANAWPEATNKYVELSLSGEHEGLLPLWEDITKAVFEASNPVPIKAILHEKDIIESAIVRPPLNSADLANRNSVIQADISVSEWLKSIQVSSAA